MDEKKNQKAKNPKPKDKLQRVKFVAYCRSNTPPGETTKLDDLVDFAKFYLCAHAKKLWKDPIWDSYTDEEILVEYFSLLFFKDEVARKEFEVAIDAGASVYGQDIYDWLDRKVAENQKEMNAQLDEMEDHISFKPDVLGE